MLRLFCDFECAQCAAVLNDAQNVRITREINGAYTLHFSYPCDEKSSEIKENRLVMCNEQIFRIMKISRDSDGLSVVNVECSHVYNADAAAVHIQNVPDFIGALPRDVLSYAFSDTPFTLMSDDEVEAFGMKWIDSDGFLIDFFSMDKTTPFDVMNTVIENCGKGEIYVDNYKIALVDRIGRDTEIRLELSRNMQNVTIERDMTSLVTRLYPYGYEDMHIGSVNDDIQYVDSPNIAIYGLREGFRDYSDYKEPTDILNHALWEFAADNEERIDVPSVNISGKLIDISKLAEYGDFMKINIGDRVTVYDGDTKISERVIRMETYPYEPVMGDVSIGRVKRDLFFYLNQMGKVGRKYNKVTTTNGKVNARSISGVVNADGIKVKDSDGTVSVLTDMIEMSDGSGLRFRCGLVNGSFNFAVYDGNGRALYLSNDKMNIRGHINADILAVNGISVTGSDGNVYINGKKILTE